MLDQSHEHCPMIVDNDLANDFIGVHSMQEGNEINLEYRSLTQ